MCALINEEHMLFDSGVTFSWGMFVGYRWLDNGLS